MLAIALVVLVLLGGLMHESRNLRERLAVYDAKAATIEQEIENEQARTEDIDKLKEYMQNRRVCGGNGPGEVGTCEG